MARQRLGQHFLAGAGWQEKIQKALPLHARQVWIEIGAGHGEMTRLLAGEERKIIAIEADARLLPGLKEKARAWPGVEVVSGDILDLDFSQFTSAPLRVYGNLPYYITSPILHHLFRCANQMQSIHVVIQLEVAARVVAKPGRREYGYLSALCQYFAQPQIVLRIPPGAFRPRPKVTSALLAMRLPGERAALGVQDDKRFLEFVQTCFRQKRKNLRNNLRGLLPLNDAQAALESCELSSDARAEELSLAQFAQLFAAVHRLRKSAEAASA